MNTAISDFRQRVTSGQEVASLALVRHHDGVADAVWIVAAATRTTGLREILPIATPAHQPTPAECYGCVDWFHY